MLRIIAGKYRGRKIDQPPKSITRPTMDRVKEAIFSSIQFKIQDAIVLDIFAGSGSLGIEALSRQAMKVIFIDKSSEAIDVINKNLEKIHATNHQVLKTDVVSYIKHARGMKFDFIFMDPPFSDYDIYEKTLKEILKSDILKPEGLIILETKNPQKISIPKGLIINREKKYGISHVLMIANNI